MTLSKKTDKTFFIIILFFMFFFFISFGFFEETRHSHTIIVFYMLTTLIYILYLVYQKRKNKFMFDKIFDLAHDGIFITDQNGVVLSVNVTFLKIKIKERA